MVFYGLVLADDFQAGLFSATVTAFTVESYKWLAEEPEDTSTQLLAFIATQLSNATLPPHLNQVPPYTVQPSDVRINTAWFLSLTLSLTTVLVGILCLQWIREFQRDATLPHKEAVGLRQMRYEGLLHWRVPQILSALPVILQCSLILFFIGLLDLLWSRDHILVAASVSALVGFVMIFLVITTVLPALQYLLASDRHLRIPQCPYKSPQSWLFHKLCHAVFWLFDAVLRIQWLNLDSPRLHRLARSVFDLDWMRFDLRWRQLRDAQEVVRGAPKRTQDSSDIIHGLEWVNDTFAQNIDAVHPVHHALRNLDVSASASAMKHFYTDIGQIDNDTLRVMLDDRFSPMTDQKRDIISAYYLHLHQEKHPALKTSYIETVIRILNSQPVPQPFYDWLSEILQELASTPYAPNLIPSHSPLNPEIIVQILLCVKGLMGQKALRTLDLVVSWSLLQRLLAPSFLCAADDRVPEYVNVHHLQIACSMFEEFENWIQGGKEIERWERVTVCAEGMMALFPPSVDLFALVAHCPNLTTAASLVKAVDTQFQKLGGAARLLLSQRWHLEYWEPFTEDDWSLLVGRLSNVVSTD